MTMYAIIVAILLAVTKTAYSKN